MTPDAKSWWLRMTGRLWGSFCKTGLLGEARCAKVADALLAAKLER